MKVSWCWFTAFRMSSMCTGLPTQPKAFALLMRTPRITGDDATDFRFFTRRWPSHMSSQMLDAGQTASIWGASSAASINPISSEPL